MKITFLPLTESHFPLLLKWLEAEHVKEWWDQELQYDEILVREKYKAHTHGIPISNKPVKFTYAYIIMIDEMFVGYIQAYNAIAFAEENGLDVSDLSDRIAGCDIFIGEKEYLGKGLGVVILKQFCKTIIEPHFEACLVDPARANIRAINMYEKCGFKKLDSRGGVLWMIKPTKITHKE